MPRIGICCLFLLYLLLPPRWGIAQVPSRLDVLRPDSQVETKDGAVLFHQSYERVFDVTLKILEELGLVVREHDRQKRYILAERYGQGERPRSEEAVGIYFKSKGSNETSIAVFTLPNPESSFRGIQNWTPIIYIVLALKFDCRINRVVAAHWYLPKEWKETACE